MWKAIKRWWKYMGAKLGNSLDENADPKVQLEQAIREAQDQHKRLKEQAANVIANQKQTDMRLTAALEELEKLNRNAQQAVLMADEASRTGDATNAAAYTNTAEAIANQLIAKEKEVDNLKTMSLQSTQAAEQAKSAVQQNSRVLQQKLSEKQKLLSQLDQAKMQEQMNTAMSSLTEQVGEDVPTLDEVRAKIESRYAKAKGMAELQDMTVESKMLEVEQASMNVEAQARLSEIRSKLGISDAAASSSGVPAAAPEGTTQTSTGATDAPARVRGVHPGSRSARQHDEVVGVDDLAGSVVQLARPTSGHGRQLGGIHPGESLRHHPAGLIHDLHRIVRPDAAVDRGHARRQQRPAP
jgi:phage shock protein A